MPLDPKTVNGTYIPMVVPLNDERASYNELLQEFADRSIDVAEYGARIVPGRSSLRSDILLTGNLAVPNELVFSYRSDQPNQGMATVLECDNRLDINDMFVANKVALMFGIRADNANVATAYLQQWPNDAALAATPLVGRGFSAVGAEAVLRAYQGWLDMEVNTVTYMEKLSALQFMYTQMAQAGQALSTVATTGVQRANAFEHKKGWAELIPNMKFTGSSKTKFALKIPQPSTFALTGYQMIVSLQLDGIRVQNGAALSNVLGL